MWERSGGTAVFSTTRGSKEEKIILSVPCAILCLTLTTTAASAVGLYSSDSLSMLGMSGAGGAHGTSIGRPGTNSLGTALPNDVGHKRGQSATRVSGSAAGATVARENEKIEKAVHLICKGC